MWCGANEEEEFKLGVGKGAKGQLTQPEAPELVLTREAEPWRGESGGLQHARGYKRAIKQGQREGTPRGLGKCAMTHSASLALRSTSSFTHQCVCRSFLSPAGLSSPRSSANLSISFCCSAEPKPILASCKVTQAYGFWPAGYFSPLKTRT